MASAYQRLYEEERAKVRAFERVEDRAGDMALLRAAMRVITKHGLAQEFVDEITKPEPKE